jgi:hypothetical protein
MAPESAEPTFDYDTPSLLVELQRQLAILEAMFGDPGLGDLRRRSPGHPAVERFDRLAGFVAAGGALDAATELDLAVEIGSTFIDHMTWAADRPGADYWAVIPDPAARAFVEGRIKEPTLFHDVVSELFWWGALAQRTSSTLGEDEGMPDLKIGWSTPCWADVKRIHVGTGTSRIRRVIEKANQQIKRADGTGVGAALIHLERRGQRASLDDRIPNDVLPFIDEARAALTSGFFRSVAHVAVTWDDYLVIGDTRATLYAFRRRTFVLEHPAPRSKPNVPAEIWEVGFTVGCWAYHRAEETVRRLRPLDAGDAIITEVFRNESEFPGGIRATHAAEVFADPQALDRFDIDDVAVVLATRKISMGKRPHVALIFATEQPSSKPMIYLGFKLVAADDVDLDELADKPAVAFQTLLRRFGLPIKVGSQAGLFIPYELVSSDLPQTELVKVLWGEAESGIVVASVRLNQLWHVRWGFAIDRARYRRSLR